MLLVRVRMGKFVENENDRCQMKNFPSKAQLTSNGGSHSSDEKRGLSLVYLSKIVILLFLRKTDGRIRVLQAQQSNHNFSIERRPDQSLSCRCPDRRDLYW